MLHKTWLLMVQVDLLVVRPSLTRLSRWVGGKYPSCQVINSGDAGVIDRSTTLMALCRTCQVINSDDWGDCQVNSSNGIMPCS